jgi:hypothetical protein
MAKKRASSSPRTVRSQKSQAAATHKGVQKKSSATAPSASASRRKAASSSKPVLGRPRIPATAELNQMFLKDYEARQVFTFLQVNTVKELEQFAAAEIIDRLTEPVVRTVERIRKALAVYNRCLRGDEQFAADFVRQIR